MSMHGPWAAYRALTHDRSVADRPLSAATWRRVLSFAVPYRPLVIAFLVTLIISALLVIAQPLLFRRIVDEGIARSDVGVVLQSAGLVALLAVVDGALGLVSRWYSARIGEGLIFDLRTRVFSHVQRQSVAFFTRTQTGALVSRLNSDVIGAQQAFTSTLGGIVGNAISFIVILITMLVLSWQLTLGALVLVPLFLLPARWLGRRLQELTRAQFAMNAEMSTQMTERFNVAGALLVKIFGRPTDEDHSFATKAASVRDAGIKIALANRVFFTSLTLVAALATALVYGVGGVFVIRGEFTLGTLLAMSALLAQLYGPLTALSNVRIDVLTAMVSFERVFEVLDLEPLVARPSAPVPLRRGGASLEFDEVTFRYPNASEVSLASLESVARPDGATSTEPILRGVSFRAEPGQLVALVGPSGAGKTTISALVPRLYDVTSGAIRINDVDLRQADPDQLRDVVGVVTQEAHLFHDTIRNNLLYARPEASEADLRAACTDAQILHLIDALPDGFDTVVGDRGHRLSGGEKQRIAIARLLLKAPDIVVLDEATAHLDSENEVAVQRALGVALAGRTSLVIAHRLSTIRDADQILVVQHGQITERGTHAQLMATSGTYRELHDTQFARPDLSLEAGGATGEDLAQDTGSRA
jgi:ATP-binding cassette, subfamily B, bacterial